VRVAPLHYKVFPETRFAEEYRLMRILDAEPTSRSRRCCGTSPIPATSARRSW
jgi:hypothetical protein